MLGGFTGFKSKCSAAKQKTNCCVTWGVFFSQNDNELWWWLILRALKKWATHAATRMLSTHTQTDILWWSSSLSECDGVTVLLPRRLSVTAYETLSCEASTQSSVLRTPERIHRGTKRPLFLIRCFRCHHSQCHDVKTSSKCEKCLPSCELDCTPALTPPSLLHCLHCLPVFV